MYRPGGWQDVVSATLFNLRTTMLLSLRLPEFQAAIAVLAIGAFILWKRRRETVKPTALAFLREMGLLYFVPVLIVAWMLLFRGSLVGQLSTRPWHWQDLGIPALLWIQVLAAIALLPAHRARMWAEGPLAALAVWLSAGAMIWATMAVYDVWL